MLDNDIKEQLVNYLQLMEGLVQISYSAGSDTASFEMLEMLNELVGLTDKIILVKTDLARTPSFTVDKVGFNSGITFAGVPLGHEFTSLVLALLQVSGRAPKVSDEIITSIKSISQKLEFETYISLNCHNCPEVVQALNLMSLLNPLISHTMIDGSIFKGEVEEREIMAVPAIFLNGKFWTGGRLTIEEILIKIGQDAPIKVVDQSKIYDLLVIGGGPAGISSAIYAARKGISVGIVADRFGGQVMDTVGVENLIGTIYTEGKKIAHDLTTHLKEHQVDVFEYLHVLSLNKEKLFETKLSNQAILRSKTVIIASGAKWRNLGVPGEVEFKNRGVAYCPHCDGPFYKEKEVAVVGGGNSGVEAAIDLAGIVKKVTLFEFMPTLKADFVLQKKLHSLPNVTVITNAQIDKIDGESRVESISFRERVSNTEQKLKLDGVFVQIGLEPNTKWIGDLLTLNKQGEIEIDKHGRTSIPGLFAAGDCTDTPYKQIVISIGSGATAALGAFDYLIRES